MRISHRDVESLVVGSRPEPAGGFTASAAGQEVLARVLETDRTPPRTRRRRRLGAVMVALGAGAVIAAGAGSAVVATYSAPTVPDGWRPNPNGAFMCASAGLFSQSEVPVQAGDTPAEACRRSWRQVFREAPPEHLFTCVSRGAVASEPAKEQAAGTSRSLLYVIDGDEFGTAAETCGSVNMLVVPAELANFTVAPGQK